MLLPHHQPEVADGVFEGALAQNVLPLGAVQLHQIGIDVVDVLALEADPRVVVGVHVSVSGGMAVN